MRLTCGVKGVALSVVRLDGDLLDQDPMAVGTPIRRGLTGRCG
jgi:hypothetical protein